MRTCLPAALAALALSGCGHRGSPAEPAEGEKTPVVTVETTAARVRPVEITVRAQGTIAPGPGRAARVAPVAAGRLIAVSVREGERVRPGQVVAILDSRPLQAQTRSAAAALAASESQTRQADLSARAAAADQTSAVETARLALQSARLDRDSAVQQAETALAAAETDLGKTRAGARPQEIAQADQAVRQAQASRDRATTEIERVQFLFERGVAARRQVEDARTALAVAESALASAEQQASLVRAGARAEDLRAAELGVQAARDALAQARASGNARIRQAQAALRQAEGGALGVAAKQQEARAARAAAAGKRADLTAASVTAGQTTLRAPLGGIVVRRALDPGDMADPATPVIEIAAAQGMNLLASLPAEEGALVRAGLPAHVRAGDGRVFAGRVLSVGQVDPQTNLLAVRIAVPEAAGRLRAGVFVTAEIVLRTHPRAVVVPGEAIVNREEKTVVFVVGSDNTARETKVETGAESGGLVEIVRGVAAGETVIRRGQIGVEDGAKVQRAKAP